MPNNSCLLSPVQTEEILSQGLGELGENLSSEIQAKLMAYLDLIIKWNKAYNLTAIRDPEDMVRLHLLDSLTIVRRVRQTIHSANLPPRIIDVGTGAGLPGMVLAILNDQLDTSLLDTNGKKCRFLNQVKIELDLKNTQVIHHRVEAFQPQQKYSIVLSRAFATLRDMTDNAQHLLVDDGRFLAMKGRYPEQELEELGPQFSLENATPLKIPGLDVERYLIELALK